jgi:AAA15 family ATPase/GTPase
VRIDAVRISNFRGIERAELEGLADSPLITVSGPNGAGKSLLFEAIALLWRIISIWERRQIVASKLIGPWADTCDVEVAAQRG